jgi:hypothetical protein
MTSVCSSLDIEVTHLATGKSRRLTCKTRDVVKCVAGLRAELGDPEARWIRAYPFGGFRRLESLAFTSAKEAMRTPNGQPVTLVVRAHRFWERSGGKLHEVKQGGYVEFRLHRTYNDPNGAWVLVTTRGTHKHEDRRGNVRQPLLKEQADDEVEKYLEVEDGVGSGSSS